MTPTLTISSLTKRYEGVDALTNVGFAIRPGERVALLGHNGAGKSTMMKIILGLIPASAGQVLVCGHMPGSPAARKLLAYLPENVAFHPALTGEEQLRHYLSLRGESPALALGLLERVGLHAAAKRRIGTYSKGMRQRVGLAQALIGRPRLLVLDEPTSGLDPVSRRDFYELLDGLAEDGASILLSSHALTEVEARTDRILILSSGHLVAEGTLAALRREADLPVTMYITARNGHAAKILQELPGAIDAGGMLQLSCQQSQKLDVLGRIAGLGDKVADLEVVPPSLEDLYSRFSKRGAQ